MAATVSFAVVDVFSNTPFKGNPLAIVDNTSSNLSSEQMKLIARQFNLSETTFFSYSQESSVDVALRSFLPDGREVFGAGHNILGVWWYLANSGRLDLGRKPDFGDDRTGADTFQFGQLLGGDMSTVKVVRKQDSLSISLRQSPPCLGNKHPDASALAAAIQISPDDIRLPELPQIQPQVVSTSTTRHLHVPVKSIEVLNSIVVHREKLLEQLRLVDENAYGLFLFTSVPGEKDKYQARFFSPGMSGEDPATGSAAGPLSALLYRNGLLEVREGVGRIKVLQGIQVGRQCEISVALTVQKNHDEERLDVDLEGTAVEVAKGGMAIPGAGVRF